MGIIIDFIDNAVIQDDMANKAQVGRINPVSLTRGLFNTIELATVAADEALKIAAYPLSEIEGVFPASIFRLQIADLFKYTYDGRLIVFRIISRNEENISENKVFINGMEDIYYVSKAAAVSNQNRKRLTPKPSTALDALENVSIANTPYILAGDTIAITPLIPRITGGETGYYLYMSTDGGASYSVIDTVTSFQVYGELVADYDISQFTIDSIGFQVDIIKDASRISTITDDELLGAENMALLGDELISFKTITPVSGNRYAITGVARGRFDTPIMDHTAGESFYWLGAPKKITGDNINTGASLYFKAVPFNSKGAHNITDATVMPLIINGRARKPYFPVNLKANGKAYNAIYSGDIVLTWDSRIRIGGAGRGDPDTVVDSWPTIDGYFEIRVYFGSALVRTATNIVDFTWTYTEEMNLLDNSSSVVADDVYFELVGKELNADGNLYESLYSMDIAVSYSDTENPIDEVFPQIEIPEVARTYAEFYTPDTLYTSNDMLVYNDGLTVEAGGEIIRYAMANIGKSSGKWYWEFTLDSTSHAYILFMGVAQITAQKNYFGADSLAFSFRKDALKFFAGLSESYGSSITDSDIIMFALNMDAGKFWMGKNSSWFDSGDPAAGTNEMFSGLSGKFYPCLNTGAIGDTITANFGASALTYTPPTGFNSGLYE